ncbi:hypothetical protein CYMTET_18271 [Cymbomonas tetramitiformis]|uniref:Uncharacterized protein n=1 Tax=Cymbomonas tetramitiformis TaxID=36881 RepID=A0AAE0G8F0_9CHLO|nr:hypothetical protein CYMTET_18271 [Cymbomonas tetramitiformis]
MSTEGSAPESSPSTPIARAAAAAAAALSGGVAASAPAVSQFLFAFDSSDEMDQYDRDSDTPDKVDAKLCYTGGKNEDRALFIRRFVEMVAKMQRAHEARGSVRCAQPPFHELKPGTTWAVCRRVEDGDIDGELSDEWEEEGTSTKGLTGTDGTEDSHYFWALRAFVAELEAKFLMKGTKEKEDLLVAKSQTTEQDGLAYVRSCRRRESALNVGRMVEDSIVRQDIEECIKGLRIKEYRERVSEQLRVSHPAPNKVAWEDLEVIVDVQDKLKNDAEAWALVLQQELVRRTTCVYSCYEARQLGLDLIELVASMRRSSSARKTGDRRRDNKKKEPAQPGGDDAKKPSRETVATLDVVKLECPQTSTGTDRTQGIQMTSRTPSCAPTTLHAHRFENHKMGITTKEWLKLPEAKQQQQQVAASAEVKEKLAAELSGLQTGAPAKKGKSTEAQAQSEASDDEAEYHSNFNEQAER